LTEFLVQWLQALFEGGDPGKRCLPRTPSETRAKASISKFGDWRAGSPISPSVLRATHYSCLEDSRLALPAKLATGWANQPGASAVVIVRVSTTRTRILGRGQHPALASTRPSSAIKRRPTWRTAAQELGASVFDAPRTSALGALGSTRSCGAKTREKVATVLRPPTHLIASARHEL